ncbi:MAG: class I SAM-dependent methyltransferase [Pseudomonadales bacterium]|nr:class I SAM-dependent methyltransferase [Pseudomonadales bacterium]
MKSDTSNVIDNNQQLLQLVGQRLQAGGLLEARRLFHGRGLCYPEFDFFTVDWFTPALLFIFYKKPDESELEKLRADIDEWFNLGVVGVATVVLQHRWAKFVETIVLGDDLPSPHHVQENGLNYRVNLSANQNIGLFLDASTIRAWVRQNAANKVVLNLFAYTCSFSVVAIAGGAEKVVNIDMSKGALSTGEINHALNKQDDDINEVHKSDSRGHSKNRKKPFFLSHNIFKSWGKLRKLGPYNLIIVDPPSYQPGSFVASKDYIKIVSKLTQLLQPEGLVISVLNSPQLGFDFLREAYRNHAPELEEIRVLAPPKNFEEIDENKGLKVIIYRLRPIAHALQ